MTTVVAAVSKWIICDFPEDNRFLSEEERAMVLARLKVDTADTHMDHLSWKTFLWIMRDWKIYCSGFMYLTCVTTSYSIALFLPSILTDMVHSTHLTSLIIGLHCSPSSTSVNWAVCISIRFYYGRSLFGRPLPPPLHLVCPRNHNLNDRLHHHHVRSLTSPGSPLLCHLPHDYRGLHNSTPHPNLEPKQPRRSLQTCRFCSMDSWIR